MIPRSHGGGAVARPGPRTARTALLALSALLAPALALPSQAPASKGQVTIFDAGRELHGELGAAARTSALDEMKALGVDVVRLLVHWRQVAPAAALPEAPLGFDPRNHADPQYEWTKVDLVVDGAHSRGMQVLLTPTATPPTGRVPAWASNDPGGSISHPKPQAFEDFAFALGSRYGDAAYVSVLNEPNNRRWLRTSSGGPGQAKLYRRLFLAASRGLRASGWDGRLLIGETGPNPPGRALDPVPFLRGTLCLTRRWQRRCAPVQADGWAHHPYALRFAPFRRPFDAGHVSIGVLGRLTSALSRAGRAGAVRRGLPLYITEFGYQTLPDPHFGVPLRRQAAFLSQSENIAYRNGRVASYAQYLLRDDPPGAGFGGFESGLRSHDSPNVSCEQPGAECKPAYRAFRTALAARITGQRRCLRRRGGRCVRRAKVRPGVLWGHVRPAGDPVTVTIRRRDRRGPVRAVRSVRTDGRGYFTIRVRHRPKRRWSVSWNGFDGPFVQAARF